jgi:hypothetical protein
MTLVVVMMVMVMLLIAMDRRWNARVVKKHPNPYSNRYYRSFCARNLLSWQPMPCTANFVSCEPRDSTMIPTRSRSLQRIKVVQNVLVPAVYSYCRDPTVLGAELYVMEYAICMTVAGRPSYF